jgi:hypothetical protein
MYVFANCTALSKRRLCCWGNNQIWYGFSLLY